jgi:hypothetical protein
MNFIRTNGDVVQVNDKDVNTLEENKEYTLYGARHNPSGEQMVSVVYNNDAAAEYADNDLGDSIADHPEDREIRTNPSAKITWRNLRLQSAIDGEATVKGRVGSAIDKPAKLARFAGSLILAGQISANSSLRDDPMLVISTAKDWYAYIQNMNTVDIGAEFAAGVSHAQRAANAMFAHEWENDPGHNNLSGRLLPGADIQDAIAKGQIAYDVLTRGRDILAQQGYGANQQEVMHKLVFDMLRSLPIRSYNFYTLFRLHPDEGNAIYSEFQSRYIPLDTAEVEMVLEMQKALDLEGDAYAFRTTANEQEGVLTARLMRSAVADYAAGDTVSVRTILMTLQGPPYNYRARGVQIAAAGGDVHAATGHDTVYMEFKLLNNDMVDVASQNVPGIKKLSKDKIGGWAIGVPEHHMDDKNGLQINKDHKAKYQTVPIAHSQTDPTPAYLAVRSKSSSKKKKKGGGGDAWTLVNYEEDYLRVGDQSEAGRAARSIRQGLGGSGGRQTYGGRGGGRGGGRSGGGRGGGRSGGGSRSGGSRKDADWGGKRDRGRRSSGGGGRGGARSKGVGRGNYLYVELHDKRQLNMKKREAAKGKQKGETRHGTGKSKKGQGYWSQGVAQYLPAGQMLQMATLKTTGEEAPYRIRFPKSHFKAVAHPLLKPNQKTLMIKKGKDNKEFIKSFQKFLDRYGLPVMTPSKDTHDRFVVPKEARLSSPYYQEVRKQIGQ